MISMFVRRDDHIQLGFCIFAVADNCSADMINQVGHEQTIATESTAVDEHIE